MKDKIFIDTNVLIYIFDKSAPDKQVTAKGLVKTALMCENYHISSQVVQEFLNVVLRKSKLTQIDIEKHLNDLLLPLCKHYPHSNFYTDVLQLQVRYQLNWYDAMIVAAALELDCNLIYSEDLQDGQELEGLTIINPFKIVD